jgi:hypothetical protein
LSSALPPTRAAVSLAAQVSRTRQAEEEAATMGDALRAVVASHRNLQQRTLATESMAAEAHSLMQRVERAERRAARVEEAAAAAREEARRQAVESDKLKRKL